MSTTEEQARAVTPTEAETTIAALKQGLIRHLAEAVSSAEGQELEPAENVTLVTADADGNPFHVERAALQDGRLFIHGYDVDDPEDQSVPTDPAELGPDDLSRLDVERLLRLVRHFAP